MYLAIDVGGTNTRIAISQNLDNPTLLKTATIKTTNNYQKDLINIESTARSLCENNILAIGLGIPGVINPEKTGLELAPNLSSWNGKSTKRDFENIFGCPTYLDNDARVAALGETVFGYGKSRDFIFIVWGSGIGGTQVIHLRGNLNLFSFEPGHQIIRRGGIYSSSGQYGDLEAYVGGKWIKKLYDIDAQSLNEDQWLEVINNFAQGIINIVAIRPTDLIIFTGGVAINQAERIKQLHDKVAKELKIYPTPEMILSKYGQEIGLYGGLALIKVNS